MNEELLKDLYDRTVALGYKKSIEEFSELIKTNDEVLNDNYEYAKSKGYSKGLSDFSFLVGKKKVETDPQAPLDGTQDSLPGSEDLSTGLEPSRDFDPTRGRGVTSLQDIGKITGKEPFLTDEKRAELNAKAKEEGTVEDMADIWANLVEQVPAAFKGVKTAGLALPAAIEKGIRDKGLDTMADIYSFIITELTPYSIMSGDPLKSVYDKATGQSEKRKTVREEFAESLQSVMDDMANTKPVERRDSAMASGDLRRIAIMSLGNAANFVPSLAVGMSVGAMTGGNPIAGYAGFASMFAGQEMASAAHAIAEQSGRTIEEVIRDGDESILIPAIIGAAAGAFEIYGFKLFGNTIKDFFGKDALKKALINVPASTMFQMLANTLETTASVYNEVHATTGSHGEAGKAAHEFLEEEGMEVALSTMHGQLAMMGMAGSVSTGSRVASSWVKKRNDKSQTNGAATKEVVEEFGGKEVTPEKGLPASVKLSYGSKDYSFGRREDGALELLEDPMTKDQALSLVNVLGSNFKKLDFSVQELESENPYAPAEYKVVATEKTEGVTEGVTEEAKKGVAEEAKTDQQKRTDRIIDLTESLKDPNLKKEQKEAVQDELINLEKEDSLAAEEAVEAEVLKVGEGQKAVVSGVEITYPTAQEKAQRQAERTDPAYVDKASKTLQEEDTNVMKKELDGEFGLLTAENPMAQPLTEAENRSLNEKAFQWLESKGYKPRRVTGKYEQAENSFFVPKLTAEDAVAFAKEFNQESVAHSNGMIYQDGTMNPRQKSGDNFTFSEYKPGDDFVSVVRTKDGLKSFAVGYDFDQSVPMKKPSSTRKDLGKSRPEPKPAPIRKKVAEALTEDGEGNYIFHHYSREKRSKILPTTGDGSQLVSREEANALSSVDGVAQYYPMAGQKETGTGNVLHTVKVPKNRVYDLQADALNFYDKAKKLFEKVRPGQAFNPNYQAAWISKVANDAGFDMVVANWKTGEFRAQTTIALKPSETNVQMKPRAEKNLMVGDKVSYLGREVTITSVNGDVVSFSGPTMKGTFSNLRDSRKVEILERGNSIDVSIAKAMKTVGLTFPGVKFIVGTNIANTRKQIRDQLKGLFGIEAARKLAAGFKNSRGQAIFYKGKPVAIIINKEKALSHTAGHEVWHLILKEAFRLSPEVMTKFRQSIDLQLRAHGFTSVADQLNAFADGYADTVSAEEYLAELGGMLTSGQLNAFSLTPREVSLVDSIKAVINKFTKALIGQEMFITEATPSNIISFMSAISKNIAEGGDISGMISRESSELGFNTAEQVIDVRKQHEAAKSPSHIDNIIEFAEASAFTKQLDFKRAMMERFEAHLPELKKIYGKDFDPSFYNEKTKEYLVASFYAEIVKALERFPSAIGWYDQKTKQALDALTLLFPEIGTSEEAMGSMIAAMAITSNGNRVQYNMELGVAQYEHLVKTGRFDPNMNMGAQQKAIESSMIFVNSMLDAGMTWTDINKFMTSEFKAGDLKFKLPNGKEKNMASSELVDTEVYGAVVLGSKVGDGFYMNLWGQFEKLTMDRWFMRTWGRFTGTIIETDPGKIKKAKIRVDAAVTALKSDPQAMALLKSYIGGISKMSVTELTRQVVKVTIKKEKRDVLSKFKTIDELRKASINYKKQTSGEKDAPSNGTERNYIREVFAELQQKIKNDLGLFIEIADIQASLWYPEKALYETFQKGRKWAKSILKYGNSEAPDYFNSVKTILEKRGITNEQIERRIGERAGIRRPGLPGTRRSTGESVRGRDSVSGETGPEFNARVRSAMSEAAAKIPADEKAMKDFEAKSQKPVKKVPTSFESFGEEGLRLFESLVKHTNSTAKYTSQDAAIVSGINVLMNSTLYKNLHKMGEGWISTDALVREFQSFMGITMRRAPTVEKLFGISTEGKRIRQEIKRNLREQDRGAKNLQRLKAQIRNFIWYNLPKSEYSKSEVMKMIDAIGKTKTVNDLDPMMGNIMDFITAKKSSIVSKAIKKALEADYTKKSGNILVAKKISQDAKDLIDYIKSALAITEAGVSRDNATGLIDRIIEKAKNEVRGLTSKEINQIVAARVVMELHEAAGLDTNSLARYNSLSDALSMIDAIIDGGAHKLKAELHADHTRYASHTKAAYEDIALKEYDDSAEGKEARDREFLVYTNKQKAKQAEMFGKTFGKLTRIINKFFQSQESLYGLMDIISKSTGEMWGGKLQEIITDTVDGGSYVYKQGMETIESVFMGKFKEIYGKDHKNKMLENREVKDTKWKFKDGTSLMLSQDTAAYLYNQYKDSSNHSAFEAKYGPKFPAMMEHLANNFLTPERKALSDWMVQELFPTLYEKYNRVYRKVNRTNMPWNSQYAGKLYREVSTEQVTSLIGNPLDTRSSTTNGSMIERQQNKNPISEINEIDAVYSYIRDMEFFHAYAEGMRDVQKIFNNREIRRAIEMTSGADVMKIIDTNVQNIIGRGMSNSSGAKLINVMTNVFYTSKLGLNPVIGVKQLTSSIAYSADIGIENWIGSMPTSIGEFRDTWREIEKNSIYVRDRYSHSIARSMEAYSDTSLGKFVSRSSHQKGMDLLMWFVKMGDKGGIMGGVSNYRFYKKEFMRKNPSATEQQAIDHAIFKFQRDTKRAQQSSDIQDRDMLQHDVSTRWLSLFQTSVKQYMRKEFGAIRQMRRKIQGLPSKGSLRQNMETFFMYHVALPMLFQYVSAGFPGVLSDWDEEDSLSMARAALLGNLNGLFIMGDLVAAVGDFVQNKPWAGDMRTLPVFQNVSAVMKHVQKWKTSKGDEASKKHGSRALMEIGALSGLPIRNIVNTYDNIESLIMDDEPNKKKALRLMMFSQYLIDSEFPEDKPKKEKPMKMDPEVLKKIDPSAYRELQKMKKEQKAEIDKFKNTPEMRRMKAEEERIKRELDRELNAGFK